MADWTGPDRTGLDWTGLDWTGPDWTGPDWTGLDWTGLDWTGRDQTGPDRTTGLLCQRMSRLQSMSQGSKKGAVTAAVGGLAGVVVVWCDVVAVSSTHM